VIVPQTTFYQNSTYFSKDRKLDKQPDTHEGVICFRVNKAYKYLWTTLNCINVAPVSKVPAADVLVLLLQGNYSFRQ